MIIMTFPSVSAVLLLIDAFASFTAAQIVKRSYGEPCNTTLRCDKGAWLSCQNSSCNCLFPENMQYNAEVAKCQALSGERCKFQVNNITGIGSLIFYETSDCVPNAQCNVNGICECGNDTFENVEGTCSPKKIAHQQCDADSECSAEARLNCIGGLCSCNSTLLLHNGSCYARAGQPSNGLPCVPGSASDIDGKCVCDQISGEKYAKSGRCYNTVSHLEKCELDEHCKSNTSLSCVNGTCSCDNGKYTFAQTVYVTIEVVEKTCVEAYQTNKERTNNSTCNVDEIGCLHSNKCIPVKYLCDRGDADCPDRSDENSVLCSYCRSGVGRSSFEIRNEERREECVGLANLPCNTNDKCVANSECKNGICICSQDYTKSSDGSCAKSFGYACTAQSKCSDSFACIDGICRCPASEHQFYDVDTKAEQCLSLIWGPCTVDSDCIVNAQCQNATHDNYKQCKCQPGFVENSEGKCDLAYGTACTNDAATGNCDRIGKLVCRDGVCGCRDNLTNFDNAKRECLGLVGSRCKHNGKNGAEACVNYASCKSTVTELGGVCKCNETDKEGKDRMCRFV